MAGSKRAKKVNITEIQNEANKIIKDYCYEPNAVSEGIKAALEVLILRLQG